MPRSEREGLAVVGIGHCDRIQVGAGGCLHDYQSRARGYEPNVGTGGRLDLPETPEPGGIGQPLGSHPRCVTAGAGVLQHMSVCRSRHGCSGERGLPGVWLRGLFGHLSAVQLQMQIWPQQVSRPLLQLGVPVQAGVPAPASFSPLAISPAAASASLCKASRFHESGGLTSHGVHISKGSRGLAWLRGSGCPPRVSAFCTRAACLLGMNT